MRVLIVDAIRVRREGLACSLGGGWVEAVATARDLEESLRYVRDFHPEVVLFDVTMRDSANAIRAVVAADPKSKVIAFGVTEAEEDILACAEAGVAGYLLCGGSLEDLRALMQSVARGEMPCSPQIGAALLKRVGKLATERGELERDELTSREREILELVDEGASNKEIAQRLRIEVGTVKNHVHNILGKLKVRRRSEASAVARRVRH